MFEQVYYYLRRNSLKKPIAYIIFVTARCNSRCRHCFYWQNLNRAKTNELSFAELQRFSKKIGKIENLSLTGGEPFLREDFAKIVLLFARYNQPEQIDIPTNGLLPNKIASTVASFLKERLPVDYSIDLSLDGLKKTHDYTRGVSGSFEKAMLTYQKLKPLQKKYGLKIKITTTLMNQNISEIELLGKYVKKNMPTVNFHNFEIMRGRPKDKTFRPPSLKELTELKPVIFDLWRGYRFYNQPFKAWVANQLKKHIFETYLEIIKEKKQVVPCLAYCFNAVLDEKGNVYFCELTPAIGNIRQKSFSAILASPEAQKSRRGIRAGKCFCTHSCFMQKSIFLNPWYYRQFLLRRLKNVEE